MDKIFLSYRHGGTSGQTGRLTDALVARFGSAHVFQDRATLAAGSNWQESIDRALGECKVMVLVVGPAWLEQRDKQGQRRIDDPDDFVHVELTTALKRGVPVLPILVNGAPRLLTDDLPEPLKAIAYVEPSRLDDENWQAGIDMLVRNIKRSGVHPRRVGWKTVTSLLLTAIVFIAVGEDEVSYRVSLNGLIFTLVALALALWAYFDVRQSSPTARRWAIGASIAAGLTAFAAADGLWV